MKIIFKIITVLFLKGIGAVFAFFFHVYISRTVAMDAAGEFFYFVSMITLLSVLARGGSDQLAVKYMAIAYRHESQVSLLSIAQRLFLTAFTGSLFVGFFLFVITRLLHGTLNIGTESIYMAIVIIPLYSLFFLSTEMLKPLQQPGLSQLLQNASIPCVFLVLSISGLLHFVDNPEEIYAISVLLCFLALLIIISKKLLSAKNIDFNVLKTPRFSIPFLAVSTSSVLFNWGGVFLLGVLSDPISVARFNAISRISVVITFVSVAVNSIFAPKFAVQCFEKRKNAARKSLVFSFFCSLGISFFICLAVIFSSESILNIFGHGYISAKESLIILCIANAINASFGTVGSYIMMSGYEKYLQWISYGAVFLYLSLVILLSNFSLTDHEMSMIILFVFIVKSIVLAIVAYRFFYKDASLLQ